MHAFILLTNGTGADGHVWRGARDDFTQLLWQSLAYRERLRRRHDCPDPAADEHRRRRFRLIPDAPMIIPLAERAVAGIAGPADLP